MTAYTVKLTDTAKQDLREIAFGIAEQAEDIEPAKRFVSGLRDECKKLNTMPHRGALPRDRVLKSMGYRFLVYKDYLILYLTDETEKAVHIMAVFHAKRDYTRVMRKFL